MDIDARGPRFGAAVTTVVLAVVLITGSAWLLAWQTLAFALGAAGGVARSPYGLLFRAVVGAPPRAPPARGPPPPPPGGRPRGGGGGGVGGGGVWGRPPR
ncbi:DUF4395 family protein, partial [Streptomyces longwoodensis]|uniref:DUF4395 family protein n=1 Tax=Streptomyces longwoodensis TaxID=68231 RepID=UPI0033FF1B7B